MLDRLERRRKRNSWSGGGKDRKVFRGNSNSMSRMLNDNKKRQGRERIVLYEKGLNDDVSSSIDKVEVSQQTMEALKSEAEILFPTSVQALATAWKQSDLVMRWHDDESQDRKSIV
uniref:Uncharacterized protein n=1 Tax=Eucampia antarctica TaxID=49252 RepID=A0A7S2SG23_9STRA|mmetsp:Transcript_7746/g.7322  ORF Transcript_7746/g.7322 Transcript_7746/m.7322 type:complete len:116 (+) Transcript_7746:45-392(+)